MTVERSAVDHVENNVGIAVVDSFSATASGNEGKHNHAKSVYKAGPQERSTEEEAADGAHRFRAFFSSRARPQSGPEPQAAKFAHERGSLNVDEKTIFDIPPSASVPGSPPAAKSRHDTVRRCTHHDCVISFWLLS